MGHGDRVIVKEGSGNFSATQSGSNVVIDYDVFDVDNSTSVEHINITVHNASLSYLDTTYLDPTENNPIGYHFFEFI